MTDRKHKVFSILLSLFVVFASSGFALEAPSVSFDAGLSSGYPFYGDSNLKDANARIDDGGFRMIIGTVADVNLKLAEYLTAFAGNDNVFDFNWHGEDFFNHLDTSFFTGVKVYPGIGGLNFSVAYSIGTRFDFAGESKGVDSASWGNGFRLGMEYNFAYADKNRYMPSIGAYYRFVPRGNNTYDNLLCVYLLANF